MIITLKIKTMANCNNLFQEFNENLKITGTKKEKLIKSKNNLRDTIRKYFAKEHPKYKPTFYIQGSYKMKTIIRTKDDTCDLDDGVYFKNNPDNVTCTTLQKWVKDAVSDVTDSTPSHRKKCITVDYAAGYNIDLPVLLFDNDKDFHPSLAVKDGDWQEDDPKDFFEEFNKQKDEDGQLIRLVKYLKAWCDNKRNKMPSGLSMSVLAMNNFQGNVRDDVALKFLLIEIQNSLKLNFQCKMPTTPNDDLFKGYDQARRDNFLSNLSSFITDAKKAVDEEENQLKASKLWQKHLGDKYFPNGKDEDEKKSNASSLNGIIGSARPYYG
jgi:hypothetical protein